MSEPTDNVNYSPTKTKKSINIWPVVLVVIILCGLSFYGGLAYEKGHVKKSSTTASATGGFSGRGGFGSGFSGQRPNIGDVTAVSSTSITIESSMSGTSKTFAITSSTTVTDNGQTSAVSDIQTGDTVVIRTSSSTSTTATAIDLNPSFGGGQGGGSAPSGTDDSAGSSDGSISVTN